MTQKMKQPMRSGELLQYIEYFKKHFINISVVCDLNWPKYLEKNFNKQIVFFKKASLKFDKYGTDAVDREINIRAELTYNSRTDPICLEDIPIDEQKPVLRHYSCKDCIFCKINSYDEILKNPKNNPICGNIYEKSTSENAFRGLSCMHGNQLSQSPRSSFSIVESYQILLKVFEFRNKIKYNKNKEL